jgi:phosphoglycolate phosphatase-like HAD superfamily hydrolase
MAGHDDDRPRGAVLFDLDGTLVDSNYQHTIAWYGAFREAGITLPLWRIHRHVGMGGDKLVPALVGDACEAERGDALRDAHAAQFASLVDEVAPLEGAHELLAALRDDGLEIVLASSSSGKDLQHYLDVLDAHELVASATTAADVEQTKPAPDLIETAKGNAHAAALAMVGDSPWDIESAARAELPCVALLTGGYSERELRDAGAEAVFASLPDLQKGLGETSIGRSR